MIRRKQLFLFGALISVGISQAYASEPKSESNSDYDGDGKTDFAVWRPGDGRWFVLPSSKRPPSITVQLGQAGDIPVQDGDYDGDKKTDFAVFRPGIGTWFVLSSLKPNDPPSLCNSARQGIFRFRTSTSMAIIKRTLGCTDPVTAHGLCCPPQTPTSPSLCNSACQGIFRFRTKPANRPNFFGGSNLTYW